jgi:hypothetical protein
MAVLQRELQLPADAIEDVTDPSIVWDGKQWVKDGRRCKLPAHHELRGRERGPFRFWRYIPGLGWLEPTPEHQPIPDDELERWRWAARTKERLGEGGPGTRQ